MPIIERSRKKCFEVFVDHMRGLVASTVTRKFPLVERSGAVGAGLTISFRSQGDPVAIPVQTNYGRLYLYLAQTLDASKTDDGKFRLRTRGYWYRLQHGPEAKAAAVLRWEYDPDTPHDRHARHHVHAPAKLVFGDGRLDLNKVHLPTGWTTMEGVIRFLIHDLGMKPPCGETWPDVVRASETRFYEEFTGKRYRPSDSAPPA